MGEHLLCKQGVIGSIPIRSTIHFFYEVKKVKATVALRSKAHESQPTQLDLQAFIECLNVQLDVLEPS